jgi:glutamine amidotransferase
VIVIIDYGMGNLFSVKKRLDRIGTTNTITSNPTDVLTAEKIILPGVGHFKKAVQNLQERQLWDALNEAVLDKQIPILGICLGMQLMAKSSEEGHANGFGWFDAEVKKFRINNSVKYKVPHMGWNQVNLLKNSLLFRNIDTQNCFYFVHSYHFECANKEDILNETIYEYSFVSAVEKNNIFGVQFHPEKSHDAGELLLENFVKS